MYYTGEMAATLMEIARRTGLSKSSVSQCLRSDGPKSHLFRPETRERVRRIAAELGYRPNSAARATAYGRTGSIALLMSINPIRSSLFEGLLCGLHDELHRNDMQLAIARMPDEELSDDQRLPKILRDWCCDGMIINYTDAIPAPMKAIIREHQIPAIWINSKQEHDCVRPDDFGAAQQIAQRLIELGHRRIAFSDFSHGMTYADPHYSVIDRRGGYERALADAGLQPEVWASTDDERIPGDQRMAYATAKLSARDRPTAVIGYSQNDLFPVHAGALAAGLTVGRDLSIATFAPAPYTHLGPPFATCILPEEEMGRSAVEMLMQKIADPAGLLPARVLKMHFNPGGTCVPPSGDSTED
jgi:LacI family transcriptional regulator